MTFAVWESTVSLAVAIAIAAQRGLACHTTADCSVNLGTVILLLMVALIWALAEVPAFC